MDNVRTQRLSKQPPAETLERHLDDAQTALVEKAQKLAAAFMAARSTERRMDRVWSDLVLKVRHDERRGFAIEWRERVWIPRDKQRGRRYVPRHVAARNVVRHAKEAEREEVTQVRDALETLKMAYRDLEKIKRTLRKRNLLGDEADTSVGFVPQRTNRPRGADGRFIGRDR